MYYIIKLLVFSKKYKEKSMKKAFSLIELLISLITISVILASLAPVVTHKLKHGGVSVGSKKLTMTCPNTVGSSCTLCLGNQCIACPIGCGSGFKNTLTCKCETCTVSNCANCNSGSNQCDRCKAGYQKNGNTCQSCSGGYYSIEGGSCQKCPKGQRSSSTSASTSCVSCTGSEYQDQEGQSSCKTCSGFVSDSNRKCTSCSAGTKWNGSSCENCPVGYYSNTNNTTTCIACSSGTYQNEIGKTSCKSCNGSNQYQDSTGQSTCKTCGANSVPNSGHTGCNSTCSNKSSCTSTQYYDGCYCQNCTAGQVPNSTQTGCYTPSTAPTSCADGKYLDGSTCKDCPTGCTKCTSASACTECNNPDPSDPDYLLDSGTCKPYKYPTSQAMCDQLTGSTQPSVTIYVPNDYTKPTEGGFCMYRVNAGDKLKNSIEGPEVAINGVIEMHKAGDSNDKCSNTTGAKCCWYGYQNKFKGRTNSRTAADGKCTLQDSVSGIDRISGKAAFNYGGCSRTVCNWYAADYICNNLTPANKKQLWSLPTYANLQSLKKAIDDGPTSKSDTSKFAIQQWSGADGLQLCQGLNAPNTVGSPRCDIVSRCYGSYVGYCRSYCIWGSELSQADFLNGDFEATVNYPRSEAYSVRCALRKYIE